MGSELVVTLADNGDCADSKEQPDKTAPVIAMQKRFTSGMVAIPMPKQYHRKQRSFQLIPQPSLFHMGQRCPVKRSNTSRLRHFI